MGSLANWLKISFHVSKLSVRILSAYTTLRWTVRSATGSFKNTLVEEGLPENVANTLARSYEESNSKILGFVSNGISTSSIPTDTENEA